MDGNDEDKYKQYANLPIPTYEEATSSRPTSSHNFRGPHEISDDAERQGLLGESPQTTTTRQGGYQPPRVESARPSIDSDLSVPEMVGDGDQARRNIEELDYMDPSEPDLSRRSPRLYHRARIRSKLTRNLSNIRATLSAIRLPTFRSLYQPVAQPDTHTSSSRWTTRLREQWRVPEQYHISGPTFARLCALFTLATLVYVLFALDIFPSPSRRMASHFDPESVRQYVQEHISADSIQAYLYHITSFDHVAGTEGDLYLAKWMQENWVKDGGFDDVAILDYHVYLNYPTTNGRSVSLVGPDGKAGWTAQLEEDDVYPERLDRKQTLAWHGHSKSGEVEGPLIYVNGGSREDFQWLRDHGVVTNGTIALVKYYGTQGDRALKVKAAGEAGCAGVLIYSDPSDDGSVKGAVWPDGPWRPEDSLQRGAVSLMSWVVGDPLTPGWASTLDAPREDPAKSMGLVQIPNLPLAWRDAKHLLDQLPGHGVPTPKDWVGGTPAFRDEWYTGNGSLTENRVKKGPVVHLKNLNDENSLQQIWNLHGLIQGVESPEEKVIIGNHRDSWCFGSVDPGSGSAVMMEVVSIFGQLRKLGWRPLRTIEFVSWDAEEYNLVGSTEYVEDNIDYLRQHGVAYLNVDVGVYGSKFRAAGSPLFERSLLHVLDRVSDPHSNSSLRQLWDSSNSKLEGLGAGSDYVAFQDMAGTSSIDFGFEGPEYGFPYHSCYETFEWMERFGDPGFEYHRTLAQVWALLILEIADGPILSFDLNRYAQAVHGYVEQLHEDAGHRMGGRKRESDAFDGAKRRPFDADAIFNLDPLEEAANKFTDAAKQFHQFEDLWTSQVLGGRGGLESTDFALKRMDYNDRLAKFETDLLDLPTSNADKRPHGVPGREQFKHVIFGPQAWSGYDEAFFPAVRDAMEVGDWKGANAMVRVAAEKISRAAANLLK